MTEWRRYTALGLEQGFTLQQAPRMMVEASGGQGDGYARERSVGGDCRPEIEKKGK
jgi:hypothetical protein